MDNELLNELKSLRADLGNLDNHKKNGFASRLEVLIAAASLVLTLVWDRVDTQDRLARIEERILANSELDRRHEQREAHPGAAIRIRELEKRIPHTLGNPPQNPTSP